MKWLVGPVMIVHSLAAAKLKADELELDEDEAQAICAAGDEVLRFYNKIPSPEVQVWLGFGGALSMVYGPRIVAIRTRLKREALARKVQPIRPKPVPTPSSAFASGHDDSEPAAGTGDEV